MVKSLFCVLTVATLYFFSKQVISYVDDEYFYEREEFMEEYLGGNY